jgi:hypothetical protein
VGIPLGNGRIWGPDIAQFTAKFAVILAKSGFRAHPAAKAIRFVVHSLAAHKG